MDLYVVSVGLLLTILFYIEELERSQAPYLIILHSYGKQLMANPWG